LHYEKSMKDNTKWICANCKREFDVKDFKIQSLIHKEKWVCEQCAIEEDESLLKSMNTKNSKK